MADINEWQFLGSDELTVAGDNIDVPVAVRKVLQVLSVTISGSGPNTTIRVNSLSGSIYAFRFNIDGFQDFTGINQSEWTSIDAVLSGAKLYVLDMANIANEEKLGILQVVFGGTAGAGNAPSRTEFVGKIVPSPDEDIDEINFINSSGGNDFPIGSSVDVAGAD